MPNKIRNIIKILSFDFLSKKLKYSVYFSNSFPINIFKIGIISPIPSNSKIATIMVNNKIIIKWKRSAFLSGNKTFKKKLYNFINLNDFIHII